jgi:hypothetical protein
MGKVEQRMMRIVLPVSLIREMDSVIVQGLGGYATRGEFIKDAIQERVLELTIGEVEEAGPPPAAVTAASQAAAWPETVLGSETRGVNSATSRSTALMVPCRGFMVELVDDLARPEGRPLFGLHNRDYPSLWALTKLASLTVDRPIPAETFYTEVIEESWKFGSILLSIEKRTGTKMTALFPTNVEKRKTAEMAFRSFAIGDYRSTTDETFTTSGPLFEWRAVGLASSGGQGPLIGVTNVGWALLDSIAEISVEEPHPAAASAHFLEHLRLHAAADHTAFVEIIQAIGEDGASRQDVLDRTAKVWPAWTENEVSTNVAGYVARAREWGLVERKLAKGEYHLTPLGVEIAKGSHE